MNICWVRPGLGSKERTAPFARTFVMRESIASIDHSDVEFSCLSPKVVSRYKLFPRKHFCSLCVTFARLPACVGDAV